MRERVVPSTMVDKAVEPSALDFPSLTPMLAMRFDTFRAQGHIPRSDEAHAKGLLDEFVAGGEQIAVFVSHQWWQKSRPDYTEGAKANLKFRTVVHGVEELIAKFDLDSARCDT